MNTKTFSRVEIKDADKGEVVCVFSTLNVLDSDDDVSLPGSFESGAKVAISSYGHGSSYGRALPVGKGSIRETKTEALMEGAFFMDTQAGKETFTVVKSLAEDDLGEWSYAYDATEYSYGEHDGQQARFLKQQKVHEVSPVLVGAGINTRTLAAKSGMKFGEHIEAVVADFDALTVRAAEVMALRAEKGKAIADVSAAHLARLAASSKRLHELLTEPASDTTADEVANEFARFVSL